MKDQTAKADAGKPRVSLVPSAIVRCIAYIREYGNNKYPEGGKDNWKQVEPERYIDALYRHVLAFVEDPYSRDEESGLPHLWHAACNADFLCELLPMDPNPNRSYRVTATSLSISNSGADGWCQHCAHYEKPEMEHLCYPCKHGSICYFKPKENISNEE